jgi:PAS domain S-box-containing protein
MKRILVVDNHPVVLKFMKDLLQKDGYQVLTAADGLSALEIMKDTIPDLVFIDLVMPNIDGKKLCGIIRSKAEMDNTIIIILSAIAAETKIDVSEIGANACVAKGPFNKMARHVKLLLKEFAHKGPGHVKRDILGIEEVYERAITKDLLSSKAHNELILDNMAQGIVELSADHKIVYANPSAVSLIGILEEELLGLDFVRLFTGKDQERIKAACQASGDMPHIVGEDNPITLNDHKVMVHSLLVKEDLVVSILIIITDVSRRIRMEQKLLQSQKMEAVGTLAGGIAHEFNNLLMGIQGNVCLLLLEMADDNPFAKKLKYIEKLIQSGSKLTSQLLGYARKGHHAAKLTDLNLLLRETVEVFGRTRKEITIHQSLSNNLCPVWVDQGQIQQVLLNLFVNAWQAMPEGGDLSVKTRNVSRKDLDPKVEALSPGNYALLEIRDTGVGMDEKIINRIFDPFFTTKEVGQGTGLGLATAYGIIKRHRGHIEVQSRKGAGTTFTIYLPASSKNSKKRKNVQIDLVKGNETILIIDDEEMIIDIGTKMLGVMGYQVLSATSGLNACRIYEKKYDRIDLVILDMTMPGMNGRETYERLKAINSSVRVLFASGYSLDDEASHLLNRGCNGFIQKPYNMNELSQKVREVINTCDILSDNNKRSYAAL